MATTAAGGSYEEVKPYKIHVSSRYLDLTKQKLEITRLPHEHSEPKSDDWWEPKPQVEPLVDFWLEQYSWRAQEDTLNDQLPQFRTAFTIPGHENPIRTHFVHIRSNQPTAVPLLLIPPFPLTNLSFGHIVKSFTEPEDVATNQRFHLVIPALPGLGFSDALPNNTHVVSTTAEILNSLMNRLDYPHYLVTNAGSGSASPAEIDWKLLNYLATQYADSCLGSHFISPPLARPKLKEAPIEWVKWSIANFFHAPILGYRSEDFSALDRNRPLKASRKPPIPAQLGLNQLGLREPNTLAYALCDSPTGLLVFVLKSLRLLGPKKKFTQTEIINFTQLAWLPGPEAAMRLWAHCIQYPEEAVKKVARRPKIAMTVFLGDEENAAETQPDDVKLQIPSKAGGIEAYTCPSWANAKYHVVYANRASGKSGLLAWERPELITAGVRGLAKEVLRLDSRLKSPSPPATAPLEQVVVSNDEGAGQGGQVHITRDTAAGLTVQPATPTAEENPQPPMPRTGADGLLAPITEERGHPVREISDETRVGSDTDVNQKFMEKSGESLAVPSPGTINVDGPQKSS